MKLKFNYYTSHLLFVIATYILTMLSNFMSERYWSGVTDILVIGIWYLNYVITIAGVEKFGDQYKGHIFSKSICLFVLVLNTGFLAASPLSIFYPFTLAMIVYEVYSILKHNSIIDKFKAWIKQ